MKRQVNKKQKIDRAMHIIQRLGREDLRASVEVNNRLWVLTYDGCLFYRCVEPTPDMTFYFADVIGEKSLRRSKLASITTIKDIVALGKAIRRNNILTF